MSWRAGLGLTLPGYKSCPVSGAECHSTARKADTRPSNGIRKARARAVSPPGTAHPSDPVMMPAAASVASRNRTTAARRNTRFHVIGMRDRYPAEEET